jgi:tRNA 2-thiouridine synthesizing protein A
MRKKQVKLDLIGFKCPIPVLKISKNIKKINVGDILIVDVDDPKAENDIEELVQNIKIKVLDKVKQTNKLTYKIEKVY